MWTVCPVHKHHASGPPSLFSEVGLQSHHSSSLYAKLRLTVLKLFFGKVSDCSFKHGGAACALPQVGGFLSLQHTYQLTLIRSLTYCIFYWTKTCYWFTVFGFWFLVLHECGPVLVSTLGHLVQLICVNANYLFSCVGFVSHFWSPSAL